MITLAERADLIERRLGPGEHMPLVTRDLALVAGVSVGCVEHWRRHAGCPARRERVVVDAPANPQWAPRRRLMWLFEPGAVCEWLRARQAYVEAERSMRPGPPVRLTRVGSLCMTPEMAAAVDRVADHMDASRGEIIRQAVRDLLVSLGEDDPGGDPQTHRTPAHPWRRHVERPMGE